MEAFTDTLNSLVYFNTLTIMFNIQITNPAVINKVYAMFDEHYECQFDINDVKIIDIYDYNGDSRCEFLGEGGQHIDHGCFGIPYWLNIYLNDIINLKFLENIINI